MSRIYLVTYDFKDPKWSMLEGFFEELKRFPAWWHFIDGTWLIKTDSDAAEIYARLQPFIDENVNLLIVEAGMDVAGWLPKPAWEWLEQHRDTPVLAQKGSS